jgi:hypothetical protein
MTRSAAELAGRRMRGHFGRLVAPPQFAAVVDCVFDIQPRRTSPAYVELCVVDDRLLFARAEGDDTFRHFVGLREQLALNLVGFVRHLGLGEPDRAYVQSRIDAIPSRAAR